MAKGRGTPGRGRGSNNPSSSGGRGGGRGAGKRSSMALKFNVINVQYVCITACMSHCHAICAHCSSHAHMLAHHAHMHTVHHHTWPMGMEHAMMQANHEALHPRPAYTHGLCICTPCTCHMHALSHMPHSSSMPCTTSNAMQMYMVACSLIMPLDPVMPRQLKRRLKVMAGHGFPSLLLQG